MLEERLPSAGISSPLLHAHFDLIAGTSTGALVALALAGGIDLPRIADLYKTSSAEIFAPRRCAFLRRGARYRQDVLRSKLRELFGDKKLSDCNYKVLVTTASLDRLKPSYFSNIESSSLDSDITMVDAALASSAAPTYFTPLRRPNRQRSYVDGGLWANSPSAFAVILANRMLGADFSSIHLLTIGTGEFREGYTKEFVDNIFPISRASVNAVITMLFSMQEGFSDLFVDKLLHRTNIIRVNPGLPRIIQLDDAKSAVAELPPHAESMVNDTFDDYVRLLLRSRVTSLMRTTRPSGMSGLLPHQK
jgi:uncharacterized protein